MKEQLNNISRELEEIKNKELTKEEQKKNKELYKTELKRQIKIEIVQEIEEQLQQGESIKDIYNYLINNDDTYISNIIENILQYKIIIKKTFKNKDNKIEYKFFNNYPFKDFDNIAEDVDNNYYTILKSIINKYTLKANIKKEELKEELKATFFEIFKKYGYIEGKKYIYDEIIKNSFIKNFSKRKETQKYLNTIYLKIARETEKDFLLLYPQPKQQRQIIRTSTGRTKQNKIKHSGAILIGSAIYGTLKGFYKASK